MRILTAMIKKEMVEMLKNYKWLIVPVLFMFFGAMQPITYYYMPEILKMASFPQGTILQIPVPTPGETMISVYSQFNQIGILVLVLISMGAIANEVKSGVAETILVKPISIKHYISSKWIAYFSITIVGSLLGVMIGYFYTIQLIGDISFIIIVKSAVIYLFYLLIYVGLSLFFSSIFTSGIAAGGITITIAIVLSIIGSLPFHLWWLPSYLLNINQHILLQKPLEYLWYSIPTTFIYLLLLFYGSVVITKNKSNVVN